MGRYERNAYFERLVALRDGYGMDRRDTQSVLLIADAIAYVDAVMTAWDLEDELETAIVADAAVVEAADAATDPRTASTPTATAPAPLAGIGEDVKRAERMARLARFFDPTTRRPPTADRA